MDNELKKSWLIRTILCVPIALEVTLFAVSLFLCTYFSETGRWFPFVVIAGFCVVLFTILEYLKSEPVTRRLLEKFERHTHLEKKFRSMGIAALFNMQSPREQDERNEVNRRIITEGTNFSLVAETASSYVVPEVRRHWDVLKARLDEKCQLRLLIVDPFCDAKAIRNERNDVSSPIDPKLRLDRLIEIVGIYPNVQLRFTTEPYCSLFFSEREMIYDPYHLGKIAERIENRFIAMAIRKESDNGTNQVFAVLQDHFEFLWNTAETLETFRESHKTQLKKAKLSV